MILMTKFEVKTKTNVNFKTITLKKFIYPELV